MLTTWSIKPLSPFGLLATTNPGADIYAVPTPVLGAWVAEHRVIILRGFDPLPGDALPEFCETLGEILEWDPAAGEDLDPGREVSFHWDGAFAERIPHYLFFHCDEAPPRGAGGEALFCDTTRLLRRAAPEDLELFEQIKLTYGGAFTSPMLAPHPVSGEPTVRYAEPDLGGRHAGVQVSGVIEDALEAFTEEMRQRMLDPEVCQAHAFQTGDIVIADNHALLHGRRPLDESLEGERASRRVRRVNIL